MGLDDFALDTQREEVGTETDQRNFVVGFLKRNSLTDHKKIVILPSLIKRLVEGNIPTMVERNLGKGADFIDLDYADVGAIIEESAECICQKSNILIQLSPFTKEDLSRLPAGQIIISPFPVAEVDKEILSLLQLKKITAISLHLVPNAQGDCFLQDILQTKDNPLVASAALCNLLATTIISLVYNANVRYAVQTNPMLLKAIFCYKGILTNAEIAQRCNVPFSDLLMLCWDWN